MAGGHLERFYDLPLNDWNQLTSVLVILFVKWDWSTKLEDGTGGRFIFG